MDMYRLPWRLACLVAPCALCHVCLPAWPGMDSFLILSLGLGLGLGLCQSASSVQLVRLLRRSRKIAWQISFVCRRQLTFFMLSYMTLSDRMEHATRMQTPSSPLPPPAAWPCLRIQQLPRKILIFINASHMQSWQLLKRTNCPSSGETPLWLYPLRTAVKMMGNCGKVWTAGRQKDLSAIDAANWVAAYWLILL